MDSFIDNHFISFLEGISNIQFSRVDADLDTTLIDQNKAGKLLTQETNKTRSELIKSCLKALNQPKVTIRAEALKSDDPQGTPPAMVLCQSLCAMAEMNALIQQQTAVSEEHILLVNTAHPLIQNLVNLSQGTIIRAAVSRPPGSYLICHHVYDLALMAQKFDAEGMKSFVERSNQVLTRLTQGAASA